MLQRLFGRLRASFRSQRYRRIAEQFDLRRADGLILDLGGGPASFFAAYYPHPERLVLVEIAAEEAQRARAAQPALHVVVADGEALPFAGGAFGLTVCNSVIEHVQHPDRLAAEVRRVSRAYFLQTPNGRFPVEPHSFIGIPFYHYLPRPARRLVCRLLGGDFAYIESVRYIPRRELQALFPDARLQVERSLGLAKSFYLVKQDRRP